MRNSICRNSNWTSIYTLYSGIVARVDWHQMFDPKLTLFCLRIMLTRGIYPSRHSIVRSRWLSLHGEASFAKVAVQANLYWLRMFDPKLMLFCSIIMLTRSICIYPLRPSIVQLSSDYPSTKKPHVRKFPSRQPSIRLPPIKDWGLGPGT